MPEHTKRGYRRPSTEVPEEGGEEMKEETEERMYPDEEKHLDGKWIFICRNVLWTSPRPRGWPAPPGILGQED